MDDPLGCKIFNLGVVFFSLLPRPTANHNVGLHIGEYLVKIFVKKYRLIQKNNLEAKETNFS